MPAAAALGIGMLPWSPLGRRRADRQVPRRACRRTPARLLVRAAPGRPDDASATVGIVEAVATAADGLATSPVAVALAWVRDRPGVTAPILGARTLGQLTAALVSETARPARRDPGCPRRRVGPGHRLSGERGLSPPSTPPTMSPHRSGLRRVLRGAAVARARGHRWPAALADAGITGPEAVNATKPGRAAQGRGPDGPAGCCRASWPPARSTRWSSCWWPPGGAPAGRSRRRPCSGRRPRGCCVMTRGAAGAARGDAG